MRNSRKYRQQGTVLVIGLILMAIMTLLGIMAMTTSTLEEKMASGAMDRNTAFQAAENGLRDAELYIFGNLTSGSGFTASCTGGLCLPSTTSTNVWDSVDWSGNIPITYGALTGAASISGVTTQPKYIIELLPDLPAGEGQGQAKGIAKSSSTGDGTAYRVTAMGWGKQPGTQVMLQSVFIKQ